MSRIYKPMCRAILQVVLDGFAGPDGDTAPLIIPVMPKEARVHRNPYRQADSWELTFDAGDLPFDPVIIRSGAAEIYMMNLERQEFDVRLINRQHPRLQDTHATRPKDPVDAQLLELGYRRAVEKFTFGSEPMIVGTFEDVSFKAGSNGKMVHVAGQDYTGYLIRRRWPPTAKKRPRRIPTGKRLDTILRQVIDEADPLGRLKLRLDDGVDESDLPIVGAKEVRSNKRGIPVRQGTSYWDVIYKLATRHGFIVFVRNLDVVLSTATAQREYFDHSVRRFAWGHNIEELELTRKMGRKNVPRIVVRSYDPRTKRIITVEYPPEGASVGQSSTPKPKTKELVGTIKTPKSKSRSSINRGVTITQKDEFTIVPVRGISDTKVLRKLAESLFVARGRPERTVRATSKDLTDWNGQSFLDLHSGDPLTMEFLDFNKEVLANPNLTNAQKVTHLTNRGFNEVVARTIAIHYNKLEFLKRPLRLGEVSFDWSSDTGINIEIEAEDFVVVDGIRDSAHKRRRKGKRKF